MSDIQQLIDTANNLCNSFDMISNNEKKFCADMCLAFDNYKWQMQRMYDELVLIKQYHGA